MARVYLGTSGYAYNHWRGLFYPPKLASSAWLPYYAQVFSTVELNTTFYRLPSGEAVERWRAQTPRGFVFACKGSRFLTHLKRLTEVGLGLDRFFARVYRLEDKLGPLLWQLPPQMTKPDPARLDRFLSFLPRALRHVFEFRHAGWYHPEICEVLDRHRAAFCEHDLVPAVPPRLTGGFRYLRFHGASGQYAGRYGARALAVSARSVLAWRRRGRDAYVYFNNDRYGHALHDALAFSELLGDALDLALPAPALT